MYVNTGVEYLLKLNKGNNPVICCESSRILESTVTQIVVLESGLETFFYRLGLVLDSLVFGLGLGHRTRQMF